MSDNPYRSFGTPLSPGDPKPESNPSYWRFRPLNTLCMMATIGLTTHVGMLLCIAVLEVLGETMFPGFTDPNKPVERGLEESIFYSQIGISWFVVLVYIFNAVVVCMFMYRANANVRSLGAINLENTPGWCCGYWFIPIIYLFKPYQCMNEIHRASSNPNGRKWKLSAVPHPLMGVWWGCWLIGGFASQFATRMARNGVDLGIQGIFLTWAIVLLLSVAAFSLVVILRSVTSLQNNPRLDAPEEIGPMA